MRRYFSERQLSVGTRATQRLGAPPSRKKIPSRLAAGEEGHKWKVFSNSPGYGTDLSLKNLWLLLVVALVIERVPPRAVLVWSTVQRGAARSSLYSTA